jgi:hypothetical protein
MSSEKIRIKLKPLDINEDGVDSQELWDKINQIIFVINELNITILEEDAAALEKWASIMEKNK